MLSFCFDGRNDAFAYQYFLRFHLAFCGLLKSVLYLSEPVRQMKLFVLKLWQLTPSSLAELLLFEVLPYFLKIITALSQTVRK